MELHAHEEVRKQSVAKLENKVKKLKQKCNTFSHRWSRLKQKYEPSCLGSEEEEEKEEEEEEEEKEEEEKEEHAQEERGRRATRSRSSPSSTASRSRSPSHSRRSPSPSVACKINWCCKDKKVEVGPNNPKVRQQVMRKVKFCLHRFFEDADAAWTVLSDGIIRQHDKSKWMKAKLEKAERAAQEKLLRDIKAKYDA